MFTSKATEALAGAGGFTREWGAREARCWGLLGGTFLPSPLKFYELVKLPADIYRGRVPAARRLRNQAHS